MPASTSKLTTAEIVERAEALKVQGKTWAQIGAELGMSPAAVRQRVANQPRPLPKDKADPIIALAAAEMENAALRTKLADQPTITSPVDDLESEEDLAQTWQRHEDDAARRIARARKQRQLTVEFPDGRPIALAFISDQHIAPGTPCDFKRMREDAELVQKTPGLYAILGGDAVDNHICIPSAVLASRSQPDDQWRLFNWYLQIFASKVLCVAAGNHDLWTNKLAGVDVLRLIVQQQQRVRYSQNAFHLALSVGGAPYRIAVRHQFRYNSSFNQSHTVKQWLRLGEEDFDVGSVSHHHEAALENFLWRGLHRIAIRPGSYQITSAFSGYYGFNDSVPLCPTVVFFPGERRMHGFFDVRQAAEALTFYRR